jgi:hypothetical protein
MKKDTGNIDVLRQRVEHLEKANKDLMEFQGFIEEVKIRHLQKKVKDLYSRLRHSKLVYKRTVKPLEKRVEDVIQMNIRMSGDMWEGAKLEAIRIKGFQSYIQKLRRTNKILFSINVANFVLMLTYFIIKIII